MTLAFEWREAGLAVHGRVWRRWVVHGMMRRCGTARSSGGGRPSSEERVAGHWAKVGWVVGPRRKEKKKVRGLGLLSRFRPKNWRVKEICFFLFH
jgi:hypothetical protein